MDAVFKSDVSSVYSISVAAGRGLGMINVDNQFLRIGNSIGEMLSGEHCCIFGWICYISVILLYVELFLSAVQCVS